MKLDKTVVMRALFLLFSILVAVLLTASATQTEKKGLPENEFLKEFEHQLNLELETVFDTLSADVNKLTNLSELNGLKKEIKKLKKVIVKSKKQLQHSGQQHQKLLKVQILQWAISNAKEAHGIDYYPKIEKRSDNQISILYVYKEYFSPKEMKKMLQEFMKTGTSHVPEGFVFVDESRYTFTDIEVMEARERFHMVLCETIGTLTGQLPIVRPSKEKGKYIIYY